MVGKMDKLQYLLFSATHCLYTIPHHQAAKLGFKSSYPKPNHLFAFKYFIFASRWLWELMESAPASSLQLPLPSPPILSLQVQEHPTSWQPRCCSFSFRAALLRLQCKYKSPGGILLKTSDSYLLHPVASCNFTFNQFPGDAAGLKTHIWSRQNLHCLLSSPFISWHSCFRAQLKYHRSRNHP